MMTSNDISQALKPVADALALLEVPYYIGGSVASSAYGVARSTLDVDVISSLKSEHVQKFVAALQDRYYISETLIKDAIKRSSSFNIIHLETSLKIDIFIKKNRSYDEAASARVLEDSLSTKENSPKFYLASPEDVILAKLEWFTKGGQSSERQWNDILGVVRVQGKHLDLEYLHKWASELKIDTLLNRILAEY